MLDIYYLASRDTDDNIVYAAKTLGKRKKVILLAIFNPSMIFKLKYFAV